MINTFEEWKKNFFNAKRFFESKGNLETRSRLKDIWYKSFFNIFTKIEKEAIKCVKHGLKKNRNFFKVFCEFHNIAEEDLKEAEDD